MEIFRFLSLCLQRRLLQFCCMWERFKVRMHVLEETFSAQLWSCLDLILPTYIKSAADDFESMYESLLRISIVGSLIIE